MYQVIARTWRPQRFSEVIGQSHVTQTLQNAIRMNRIGHGYIFSGQRGVGKTTLARLLAKALNCKQGPAPEPCGECDSCREVAAGRSVDVLEIDAASNRGIDAVRELRENARYAPARDRYKVFIIDEAHQITPEGFNALLKTLEEPPPHVVFILATTEAHQFPETILSRCQHFSFRAVPFPEVYAHLEKVCAAEKVAADAQALSALTAAGEGSIRDALSRLEQAITAFGSRLEGDAVRRLLGSAPSQMIEEVFEAALAQNRSQMLDLVERLVVEGYQIPHFCAQLVRTARNLLVARVSGPGRGLIEGSAEELDRCATLAQQFSEEQLMQLLGILLELHQELRHTMEPRFQMELGLLKLVDAERLVPIEEALGRIGSGREGVPGPAESSASPKRESASARVSKTSSLRSTSASRPAQPSPFEQDLARKQETGRAVPSVKTLESPATDEDSDSGSSVSSLELSSQEVSSDEVSSQETARGEPAHGAPEPEPQEAEHHRGISEELPSREIAWVHEVLRRLEEASKPVLASLLEDDERWEFSESEVTIRLADSGIARVLPDADRRFLDQLVSDVVGRPVRVQFGEDWKGASTPSKEASSGSSRRPSKGMGPAKAETPLEGHVRSDPEVAEFESLFGKRVTDIRRRKE